MPEVISGELSELAWIQLQQFEALVSKPYVQQLPPDQLRKGIADASVCMAAMHCLNVLRYSFVRTISWQPGRRNYRLLANMILRGLRRIKLEPYGASLWMSLVPPMLRIFAMAFATSGCQSQLEDTAEAVAKTLLKASEQILAGPLAAGEADTLALYGAPPCLSPTSSPRRYPLLKLLSSACGEPHCRHGVYSAAQVYCLESFSVRTMAIYEEVAIL